MEKYESVLDCLYEPMVNMDTSNIEVIPAGQALSFKTVVAFIQLNLLPFEGV